jgi:N-methylhydantoinase B
MLSCSQTWRKNMMAVWDGSAFVFNVFGKNQYGEPFGTMMVNSHMGGGGARYFADGHDNSGSLSVPRASVTNVESAEAIYPILYLFRRRAVDSGGAGRFRGGVSGENAITPYGTERIDFVVSTLGSNQSNSAGIGGGYPGGGAQPLLKRGTEIIDRMAAGFVPSRWEDLPGEEIVLPAKEFFTLLPGDVFNGVPHGGGGFGDPLERDPERVQEDVLQGLVSFDYALRIYGVVLDPVTTKVRTTETDVRRDEIRRERLAAGGRGPTFRLVQEGWRELRASGVRLGETLRVRNGEIFCARCEEKIASSGSNPKKGTLQVRRNLGQISPWIARRWAGVSPDFLFVEYACPGCGYLIDAAQRRVGESEPWDDYRLADLKLPQSTHPCGPE